MHPLEEPRHLQHRVLAHAGHGRVAGAPVRAHAQPADALLAERDGVEAPAPEVDRDPAALVDDQVAADEVGALLAQPARAQLRSALLVGGDHHQQIARRGPPSGAGEGDRRRDLGRDLRLHVERPATPHLAVAKLAGPRIARPVRRGRPGPCRRGSAGRARGPATRRAGGRRGSAGRVPRRAARTRSRRSASRSRSTSCASVSFPGGFEVSIRISCCSRLDGLRP